MLEASKKTVTFKAQSGKDSLETKKSSTDGEELQTPGHSKQPSGIACPTCGSMLPTPEDLVYHLIANCQRNSKPLMGCTYCDKKFTSVKDLKEHLDFHLTTTALAGEKKLAHNLFSFRF